MSAQFAVVITGLREWSAACGVAGNIELPREMRRTNKELAEEVASKARGGVHSISGKLAGSIRGRGGARSASVVAGNKSVPYAAANHWGWPRHHITGNPFLKVAADQMEEAVVVRYRMTVDSIIGRML